MLVDAIERISSTRTAFNSQYAARARTDDDDDDDDEVRALTESRPRGRGTSADRQALARSLARSPAAASARLVTTSAHAIS